jgi:dTDP-4-dehydrorhamnose reductase
VQTLLVAGLDSLVGTNLALTLSEDFDVVGLAAQPLRLDPVHANVCQLENADDVAAHIRSVQPDWIVYCGATARSSWDGVAHFGPGDRQAAVNVAREANASGCPLTMISTDAVFSGPWLFHDEEAPPRADGWLAQAALSTEAAVREHCPSSLIVRTHAYGWTQGSEHEGFLEPILEALESGTPISLEADRGATPILASDLSGLLAQAFRRQLTGLYHIAGSERTTPYQFAKELADVLALSADVLKPVCHEPPDGKACETSLRVRRIHAALGNAMPMLHDGLVRLAQQRENGFAERIHAARAEAVLCENVA